MSHQSEGSYVPKFVSKQIRAFCKRKQASHGGSFIPQRHNAQGELPTRRNSARGGGGNGPAAQTAVGSVISLSRIRQQQSASIRESLADMYQSAIGSTESITESLSSDTGDLEEPPEIEETAGACAVIEIVGYSALIESLGQRGSVPSHVVARSLESYFSKIIDIIEEYRGDVVKITGDSLYVCWRCNSLSYNLSSDDSISGLPTGHDEEVDYFVGDSRELKPKTSSISDAIMTAIVCCMLCINFLKQSEIWALEDISSEFLGLKLSARCVIGSGTIYDAHLGVRGIRMDSVLLGNAFCCLQESLKDSIQINELAIESFAHKVVSSQLEQYGIKAELRGECSYVLQQPTTGIGELQALARVWSERIVYGEVQIDHNSVGTLIESYLPDGAAFYLRTLRKQRRGLVLFSGSWTHMAAVAMRLRSDKYGSRRSERSETANSGTDTQILSLADAIDYSKEAQRMLVIVLKCCRAYNMILHRVFVNPDGSINILCTVGGNWSGSDKEREVVAAKMALATRDALSRSTSKGEFCGCFVVGSGLVYEGLLVNRHRCEFRLVGEFLNHVENLARKIPTINTIIADMSIFDVCSATHMSGYFHEISEELQESYKCDTKIASFEQLYEIVPKSATIAGTKGFVRFQDIEITAPSKETVAFREEIDKIQRACMAASYAKTHTTLLIEGSQGSGKTFLMNRTRATLESAGYCLCIAEARENESYRHPLYPYALIVPQLLDLIDATESKALTQNKAFNSTTNIIKSLAESNQVAFVKETKGVAPMKDTGVPAGSPRVRAKHIAGMASAGRGGLPKAMAEFNSNEHMGQPGALNPPIMNANSLIQKSKSTFSKLIQKAKAKARIVPIGDHSDDHDKLHGVNSGDVGDGKGAPVKRNTFLRLHGQNGEKDGQGNEINPTEALRACLIKAGEDPDLMLPLLNVVVLPEISETKETKGLAADGRTFLLSGLIVRLIKRITETRKLAILIDDVHWMDSASWQITMQIIRRCEHAMVALAASSTGDYRYSLMMQVKDMPQTESIELRGWSSSDTERYLQHIFCNRAKSINKEVVDIVRSQCESLPAYIDCMARFLTDFDVLSCEDGEIVSNIDPNDLELRIPNTFANLVLWQYDHLRSKEFQRFLRCAATIGRNFSLEEIAAIWNESSGMTGISVGQQDEVSRHASIQRLAALVKVYDIFDMVEQRIIDEQYMDPSYPFRTLYCFRHSAVREAIYNERMSEFERKARHYKLIRFYERQLTDETEPIYIPLICHHHRFAGVSDRTSVLKRIQYMVMLGTYVCVVAEAFMETREIFNEIDNIIVQYNLAEDLGASIISELHVRLGAAYSHGISDQISRLQGLRHLLIAINLLDFTWPKTDTEWWKMVWSQGLLWGANIVFRRSDASKQARPNRHRNRLLGSIGRDTAYSINKYLERLERLEPVLDMMSRHLFETDARLRDQIGCDLLCLNVAFKLGRHVSKARIRLLISLALKFWFAGYLNLAIMVADRSNIEHSQLSDEEIDPVTFASSASFYTACGYWSEARKWASRGMEICQSVGDLNGWLICSHQRCFMLIYDGRFQDALALEKKRGYESRMNGASFGALWSDAVVAQILLLQGDTVAAKRSRIEMDRHYKLVPPQLRAQFQGIFAQLELVDGDFDACLGCVERVIDLIPKIHYSNNQAFYGVLLGVLAMYSMIEHSGATINRPRKPTRTLTNRSTRPARSTSVAPMTPGIVMTATPTMSQTMGATSLGAPFFGALTAANTISAAPHTGVSGNRSSISVLDGQHSVSMVTNNGSETGSISQHPSQSNVHGSTMTSSLTNPTMSGVINASQTTPPYEISSSNLAGILSSASLTVDRMRIRRIGMTLISVLQPFQGHALCEPMVLLVRGLIRAVEGSAMTSLVDGPTALCDWVRKFEKNPGGDMRFMVGVLAIKSWRISGEQLEWMREKKIAEQIFSDLGIEGCLKIL